MWEAGEDAAVHKLANTPEATASDIGAALCALWSSSGVCSERDDASQEVVALGPHLFVASLSSGEVGTVFIVGLQHNKPLVLWSISTSTSRERDPRVAFPHGAQSVLASPAERTAQEADSVVAGPFTRASAPSSPILGDGHVFMWMRATH